MSDVKNLREEVENEAEAVDFREKEDFLEIKKIID